MDPNVNSLIKPCKSKHTKIISVGSGKGGVGKSFISSSLGICFSKMNYKTLIIDLDLGAANMHTSFNMRAVKSGLGDFINKPDMALKDCIAKTSTRNLDIISGQNDSLDMANIDKNTRQYIMKNITSLTGYDYIILDLGAGTHESILDFFLLADYKLMVITPLPTSIENVYRFMKISILKYLKNNTSLAQSQEAQELLHQFKLHDKKTPRDLLYQIGQCPKINIEQLEFDLNRLSFKFILNQARSKKDSHIGSSVTSVAKKHFGLPTEFLGYIDYNNAVWQSLQDCNSALLNNPQGNLYAQLVAIAKSLVDKAPMKFVG